MANHDMIIDVLVAIKKDPDSYYQGSYGGAWTDDAGSCGTTACIAGHAAILAGRQDLFRVVRDEVFPRWIDGRVVEFRTVLRTNATRIKVAGMAALELTGDEASYVFYGGRTLDEIYAYFAKLMEIDLQVLVDKVIAIAAGDELIDTEVTDEAHTRSEAAVSSDESA